MSRDWRLYWQDVIDCCGKVERYVAGLDRAAFESNSLVYDAVLRNLEVIGEAVKKLPPEATDHCPQIEWRKIAGMRDVLAHAYFGIDNDIVWSIVSIEVPRLKAAIEGVQLP